MRRLRPGAIKALSTFHAALFRATGSRLGRRLGGHDILLLTTTGRVSGQPHTVPLLYLPYGEAWVLIASFAGHDRHPAWYLNLRARPRARIQVGGRRLEVTARDAGPDERARLWAQAVVENPGYAGYQARTDRVIPIVVLQRA